MRAGLRYYLRESRVCVDLSVCRGVSARSDLSGAIYRRSLNNVPIYGKRVRERLQTPNRYSVSGHAHISDVLYCNKVIKCKSHHNSSLDCVYKEDGTREHTHIRPKALNKAANAVQCLTLQQINLSILKLRITDSRCVWTGMLAYCLMHTEECIL